MEFIADHCTFRNNQALNCGGALSIQSTLQATIKNCTFNNNFARKGGGAICLYPNKYGREIDQLPSCTILGCNFNNNYDLSNNCHDIFFKYAYGCHTSIEIKECQFIYNFSNKQSSI